MTRTLKTFGLLCLLGLGMLFGTAKIACADGSNLTNWAGSTSSNNLWFDPDPGHEFVSTDTGRTFYSSTVNFKIVAVITNFDMTAQGEGVHTVVKVTLLDGSPAQTFPGTGGLGWNYTSASTAATPGDLNKILVMGDSITAGYNQSAGPPAEFEKVAYAAQGRTVTMLEEGVSGTGLLDVTPGSTSLTNIIAAAKSAGCGTVELHYGVNDAARDHLSASDFITHLTATVNALLDPSTGIQRCVVFDATWGVPGGFTGQVGYVSAVNNALVQSYNAALPAFAAATPNVSVGGLNVNGFFQLHPQLLGDGLHPNNQGATDLGYLWAGAAPPDGLSTFGVTVATALSPPAYTWVSGSLVTTPGPVVFTVTPLGGTGTITYTLTRPGMTAVSNTTGILTDTTIVPGMLNSYTITATDSAATPITKTITQSVVPLGAYTAAAGGTASYLTPTITHNSSLQPVLAWLADSTATGYVVLRSVDNRATYQALQTVPAGTLTYTDTARPAGGTVYYHVVPTH